MLQDFLERINNAQAVDFAETMAVINQYYHYQPVNFSNGVHQPIVNTAGTNEGSCKIFAFAKIHQLNQAQTLALFGDFYRHDVLGHPDATDHQNIRTFMRDGWDGVVFTAEALTAK